MNLKVMSRGEAADFTSDEAWAVISIKSPEMSDVVFDCPNLSGCLRMEFDDIDRILPGTFPFTQLMAKQVWDFVLEWKDKVSLIGVHCNMGVSRSPAIAASISKALAGDDQWYFTNKEPNMRVYRIMLHEAHQRGLC